MSRPPISKQSIKEMMKYDLDEFFENNDNSFDYPPPIYETPDTLGWKLLSKAIFLNNKGIEK